MEEVIKDVHQASNIVNDLNFLDGYDRIYYQSNENLNELFKHFSVEGKDVLTVLGYSDHLFHSYYHGAKSVDAFDVNKLAKYYFYLRKWVMECYDDYYPERDLFLSNNRYIFELLKNVSCKSEDELDAYLFWSLYIERVYPFDAFKLYYASCGDKSRIDNVDGLKEIICSKNLNFRQEDLSGVVDKSKKYDIVIISNILEYYSEAPLKLAKCRDNLKDLVKDGGLVITSRLMEKSNSSYRERERALFERYFDTFEFPSYVDNDMFSMEFSLGCAYQKRKVVNKK